MSRENEKAIVFKLYTINNYTIIQDYCTLIQDIVQLLFLSLYFLMEIGSKK